MPAPVSETPQEVLQRTRPTPEVLDSLVFEMVRETKPSEIQDVYGTPNLDTIAQPSGYSGFRLVKEEYVNSETIKRWWYNGPHNEDTYNYDIDYVSDSATHRVYRRRYLTLRTEYEDETRALPLSGVWQGIVGNPGTGYDAKNPPNAVVSGGGGTDAEVGVLINPDGTIGWLYIKNEGRDYTSTPVLTIDPPVSGVTGTGTLVIQDQNCVLISQKAQELPQDDPRRSLYLMEVRLFQTFPGPILSEWRFVPRINKYALIERQLVLISTIPEDNNEETYDDSVTVEYQDLSAVYAAKLTTTLPTAGLVWIDENTTNDFIYEGTEDYAFPDEVPVQPQLYMIVAALSNGAADWDFAMDMVVREGYRGPCRCVFSERFTFDPADADFIADLPAPTLVIPQGGTIRTGVVYYGGDRVSAKYYTWVVPASLHPAFNYSNTTITINGSTQLPTNQRTFDIGSNLGATTPTGFASGDHIVRVNSPQRLGIGKLWCVLLAEIYHP